MGKQARRRRGKTREERIAKRLSPVTYEEWRDQVFTQAELAWSEVEPGNNLLPQLLLETARGERRRYTYPRPWLHTHQHREHLVHSAMLMNVRQNKARKAAFFVSLRNAEQDVFLVITLNSENFNMRAADIIRPEDDNPRIHLWRPELSPPVEYWTKLLAPLQDSLVTEMKVA